MRTDLRYYPLFKFSFVNRNFFFKKSSLYGSVFIETVIDSVHTQTMKIVLFTKDRHLKASSMYCKQRDLKFSLADPPRWRPVGCGGNHHNYWIEW
jgi:hypothetical protein